VGDEEVGRADRLYRRYVRAASSPDDDENARFEFGLDCLLDGMAARLDLPSRPPR
jgi:hypothetical protein